MCLIKLKKYFDPLVILFQSLIRNQVEKLIFMQHAAKIFKLYDITHKENHMFFLGCVISQRAFEMKI